MENPPSFARRLGLALLAGVLVALPATLRAGLFSPKGDTPAEKRQVVQKQRDEMLAELYKTKPELKARIAKAAGYGTFKQTDLNLFIMERTKVTDLGPLVAWAKADAEGSKRFAPFLRLYLKGNELTEQAKNEQLAALKAIGVRIDF